jgi:phage anti-repressor protein
MQNKLDIVSLIEKNPLVRLSKNYENKFVQKIQENFTESQQQLFISSFYCYLNYNSKTDFIIELESVWKWLGFGRKEECKRVLTKHFKLDIDYKIVSRQPAENPNTHIKVGGRPKEISLMTINTFKKLCLKSDTKKADEIHDYFIKLEETLQEIVNEESNELKLQLSCKEKEYKKTHEELAVKDPSIKWTFYPSC